MSALISQLAATSPILWLPVVGLVVFIVFFGAVVVRVARRGAAAYDRDARLPLERDHV